MSVDAATVRRIAHLARIAVADHEIDHLRGEINGVLAFVEQLNEVNVDGVEPLASVESMGLRMREDVVNDGGDAARVLANAPASDDGFYLVPKVVE
jgi:aspartyl-tRNA(Asn)/glutamyl-tRNA(Gln) amidotransferase subunit C